MPRRCLTECFAFYSGKDEKGSEKGICGASLAEICGGHLGWKQFLELRQKP